MVNLPPLHPQGLHWSHLVAAAQLVLGMQHFHSLTSTKPVGHLVEMDCKLTSVVMALNLSTNQIHQSVAQTLEAVSVVSRAEPQAAVVVVVELVGQAAAQLLLAPDPTIVEEMVVLDTQHQSPVSLDVLVAVAVAVETHPTEVQLSEQQHVVEQMVLAF
jgi:hypothetical protein